MSKPLEETMRYRVDLSELKSGIREANQTIREANAEFKLASAGMDDWRKSSEGLQAKVRQLEAVIAAESAKLQNYKQQLEKVSQAEAENAARAEKLRAAYQKAVQEFGKDSAEAEKLKQALTTVETEQERNAKSAEQLSTTITNQTAKLTKAESQLGKYRSQLAESEGASSKLKGSIDSQQAKLDELKRRYTDVALAEGKNSAAARELAGQISRLSSELQADRSKLDDASAAADRFDHSMTEAGTAAKTASEGFTVFKGVLANLITGGLQAAGRGIAGFAKSVVQTGMEFKAEMSNVKALSGATEAEFSALTAKAEEMGAKTQFTAKQSAEGLGYMALAGWNAQQMTEGLPAVLNLAAAAGMDLGRASDIVTDDLTAFGLKAEDAAHFTDVLAAASTKSNTDVDQLGEAFKYAASTAGALGYSVEDTSIAIGLMANAGIKGSQAGTTLRTAMSNLANPTDRMQGAMDRLGISLTDEQGNTLSLMEVMGELRGAIGNVDVELTNADGSAKDYNDIIKEMKKSGAGLTKIEKVQAAATIFGKNAMAGMLSIIQAAPEDYENLTDAIYDCDGAAKKMADTVNDNLKGDIVKLSSAFDGVKINLEKKVDAPLRQFIQNLTRTISGSRFNQAIQDMGAKVGSALSRIDFSKVLQGIENFVSTASNLVQAVVPIVTGVWSAVSGIINLFSEHLDALTGGLIAFGIALAALKVAQFAAGISTMVEELMAATAAMEALSLATGPIGLIAAAAGAAVALGMLAVKSAAAAEKADENVQATEAMVKKHNELTESLERNQDARDDATQSAKAEGAEADIYADKLEKLMAVEDKSVGQKKLIKDLVEKLNESVGNLNLVYDEEKDTLNKSTEAIRDHIAAQKDLLIAQAMEKNMQSVASDMAETYTRQAEAQEQLKNNEEAYYEAQRKRVRFEAAHSAEIETLKAAAARGDRVRMTETLQEYEELEKAERRKREALEKSQEDLNGYTKQLGDLSEQMDRYSQASEDFSERADLKQAFAGIIDQAEGEGIKVPAAVKRGMEAGAYAIPESIDGLNNLIKFDKALGKAGLDGVQIPQKLSEGINSGKVSVDTAIEQLQAAEEFNNSDAVQKAAASGMEVPEALAQGIANGKISVDEALQRLSELEEFNNSAAVQQAEAAGFEIDEKYAASIVNGKATASEAAKKLTREVETHLSPNTKTVSKNSGKAVDAQAQAIRRKQSNATGAAKANASAVAKASDNSTQMKATGAKNATSYADGEKSKTRLIATTSRNLSKTASTGAGAHNGAFRTTAIKGASSYISGLISKIGSITGAGRRAGSSAVSGARSGGSGARGVGTGISSGIASGISSGAGAIASAAAGAASRALAAAKAKLGIKSPSRVFRDQVGKNIVLGVAEGIGKNVASVISAMSSAMQKAKNAADAMAEKGKFTSAGKKLTDALASGLTSSRKTAEKAVTRAVNSQIASIEKQYEKKASEAKKTANKYKKSSKQYKKYIKEYQKAESEYKKIKSALSKAGREVISEYKDAVSAATDKAKKAITNKVTSLAKAAQKAYDELKNRQSSMQSNLAGYGNLFSIGTSNVTEIADLGQNIKLMEQYASNLKKLKKKVGSNLMDYIASLDTEQGLAFSTALLRKSDKELNAYSKQYDKKISLSKSIAKNFYSDQIKAVKADYTDKVQQVFKDAAKRMKQAGENAVSGFIVGLTRKANKADSAVKKAANHIVKAMNKALKIHSPSRVFEQMGIYSGMGYENGLTESLRRAQASLASAIQPRTDGGTAGGAKQQAAPVTYNFYQTNNSPKSLSRLEIYRQTRNQLALARG